MTFKNQLKNLRSGLIVLVVATGQVVWAEPIGRLGFLQGDVEVNGKEVKEGHFLNKGDIVETKDGKVAVLLGNESAMHLDRNSRLVVNDYALKAGGNESGAVDLKYGRTRTLIMNKGQGTKSFFIRSKTATMGVRGTELVVDQPPAGNATVVVISGNVDVVPSTEGRSAPGAKPISLGAGQSASVAAPAPQSAGGGGSGGSGGGSGGGGSGGGGGGTSGGGGSSSGSAVTVANIGTAEAKAIANDIAPVASVAPTLQAVQNLASASEGAGLPVFSGPSPFERPIEQIRPPVNVEDTKPKVDVTSASAYGVNVSVGVKSSVSKSNPL